MAWHFAKTRRGGPKCTSLMCHVKSNLQDHRDNLKRYHYVSAGTRTATRSLGRSIEFGFNSGPE